MSDSYLNRRQVLSAVGASIVASVGVSGQAAASSHDDGPRSYSAELTGDQQVPPVETDASGHATFEVREDGTAIDYEVHVSSICNVTQAHVHLGEEGENGPVVVWLYPEDAQEPELIEGRFDGTLASGTITEDDLVGPLEGASLEEAAETLEREGRYVNVHTEQHPDGEIRGQVRPDEAPEEPIEEPEEEPDEEEEEEEEEPDDEDGLVSTAEEAEGMLQVVEINVDVGDRNPDDEYITFENAGDRSIDMSGWILRDRFDEGAVDGRDDTDRFTFPSGFVLDPGSQVTAWSGTGSDDDENLYWGATGQNIWLATGDDIVVKDANRDIALEHSYGDQTASITFVINQIRGLLT